MQLYKAINNKYFIVTTMFVVFVMAIVSINFAATGAFYTGNVTGTESSISFGSLDLDPLVNTFVIKDAEGEALDTILPGDTLNVSFQIENTGTADMYLRFQLSIIDIVETANKVGISYPSAPAGYTIVDYDLVDPPGLATAPNTGTPDLWYVRNISLIGNVDTQTNSPPESIDAQIIVSEDMSEEYEGVTNGLSFNLDVKVIQVANNGTSAFNCDWTGS
jgi:hypothetical protein